MKRCCRCARLRPLVEFSANHKAIDRKQSQCKECANKLKRDWRKNNPQQSLMTHTRWRRKNPKLRALYASRWRQRNPEKRRAHRLVAFAVRRGQFARPSYCEDCKQERMLNAHHDNYNKPLEVRWLCPKCHVQAHSLEFKG